MIHNKNTEIKAENRFQEWIKSEIFSLFYFVETMMQ